MYIEIHDWQKFEQKIIYFKLNNALNMQINNEANYKFKGVYAIYKDDLCLYVGQSNNLASRVATHLSGKYKNATHFKIWDCSKFDVDLTLDQFEQWLMPNFNQPTT